MDTYWYILNINQKLKIMEIVASIIIVILLTGVGFGAGLAYSAKKLTESNKVFDEATDAYNRTLALQLSLLARVKEMIRIKNGIEAERKELQNLKEQQNGSQ